MVSTKRIAAIEVIKPGSNPDVDSDFNTEIRDLVLEHCEQLYGHGSLANIVTFSTLAAKGAFKAMCTIYNVPFAQANKIASLIPPPIEGVECTIEDIFNPKSDRYSEGADFRTATSGSEWTHIIAGAQAIEGRNKATGVHPCGIVMSSKPLNEVIPLQVRQSDNRVISQWNYPELESMGLIKFDFLGLDTVDLLQHTVEYIKKGGKTPPNLVEIIHGDMDDKKTYEMLSRGDTIGIFQLASPGVQDLLRRMKPTELDDITATTALYRPGPMGMLSHVKYADRKNGREIVEYPIHSEFKGSPLETILEKTYSLVVYQEQIIQIANQIAGMTLQEGDDLRKAMGKKKMDVMVKMKPKFMEGGIKNGYSEESLNLLWDTIAEFAKYGFNKSHSVAYAMNAYQAAFLKANYPVEFMAALIAQNVGNKDKILVFLQEARKMGLKVGSADINASDVRVSPDFTGTSEFQIVYGLSGVNAVSKDAAKTIIAEREKNGKYKSVQDLINRCSPLGISNRKIYENLALAGAFDSFGVSRQSVVENLPAMLGESKVQQNKGTSLFDMFGGGEAMGATSINLNGEEYPHVLKLKKEADVIGLYLTAHPLSNAGNLSGLRSTSIAKLLKSKEQVTVKIVGSLTDVAIKRMKRGGKSVAITLDDGTGYVTAFLNRELIKGFDKRVAQERVQKLYENGATEIADEIREAVNSDEFVAREELEKGMVYSVTLTYRPGFDDNPYAARIGEMNKVALADDGSLPIRIRLPKPATREKKAEQVDFIKRLAAKNPGDAPVYVTYVPSKLSDLLKANQDAVYLDALDAIDAGQPVLTRGVAVVEGETEMALTGQVAKKRGKKEASGVESYREWPPPAQNRGGVLAANRYNSRDLNSRLASAIEALEYKPTKFMVDKNRGVAQEIEAYIGIENFDFGVFNSDILTDD